MVTFAYPTTAIARKFGYGRVGCWIANGQAFGTQAAAQEYIKCAK
jgi:hypothetical protein